MKFTYATHETQIGWSEGRSALAEYVRGRRKWILSGWLYEGDARTWADAVKLTHDYLQMTALRSL
jgi:hypothetical protein